MDNSPGSNSHNKEEILAKSRQSKKDEGIEHAEVKGFKLGERVGSVTAMFLVVLAFFIGQPETIFAIGTIIFATVFGQCLTVYRFKKSKYLLAWLVLTTVFSIHFFVLFLAATQEWAAILDMFWKWPWL